MHQVMPLNFKNSEYDEKNFLAILAKIYIIINGHNLRGEFELFCYANDNLLLH